MIQENKKFTVHVFEVVKVKIVDVEAATAADACEKARDAFTPETLLALPEKGRQPGVEWAEETSHYLVDPPEGTEHSEWYVETGDGPVKVSGDQWGTLQLLKERCARGLDEGGTLAHLTPRELAYVLAGIRLLHSADRLSPDISAILLDAGAALDDAEVDALAERINT